MNAVAKFNIFFIHSFRLAWSYKLNFVARFLAMLATVLLFFFLDQLLQSVGLKEIEGGSYFAFALIGSAFIRFLNISMRAFSLTLREEMLMGTIEPMLVTATPTVLVLVGPATWMLFEGVILLLVQLVLGILLGADFSQINWLSTAVIMVLSLASVICFGVLAASFTIIFKRGDPISFAINAVAYVFSGVYFPIEVMPPGLRVIAYLLPSTFALSGLRGSLLRGASLVELGRDVLALTGFTLLLLPVSVYAMRYAIQYLKQTGELGHY